jgi:hypothetical protein
MNTEDIIRIAKAVGLGEIDDAGDIWCSDGFYTEEIDSFAQFAYDAGRKAERKKMELDGIHTCSNECQRPACVAVREAVKAEREWVGLTDEEIKQIVGGWGSLPIDGYTRKLFDQIEAKLKEKNT